MTESINLHYYKYIRPFILFRINCTIEHTTHVKSTGAHDREIPPPFLTFRLHTYPQQNLFTLHYFISSFPFQPVGVNTHTISC